MTFKIQHGSLQMRLPRTRERRAGRSSHRRSELHCHRSEAVAICVGYYDPTWAECVMTSTGTRLAGRIRRRGKRLQAHRREPVQTGRVPLVESGRQRPARRRMSLQKHPLARLPLLRACRAAAVRPKKRMYPQNVLKAAEIEAEPVHMDDCAHCCSPKKARASGGRPSAP